MKSRNNSRTFCLPVVSISTSKAVPESRLQRADVVTGVPSSKERVDELLRAFSDVAFSSEEDELPWESWNYTRLSTF